ncbi:MAG: hypothetical protein EBZ77_05570 [Chitinophagia bacterium]|nr:hypothetical protein [Chitinophagia bacterium]
MTAPAHAVIDYSFGPAPAYANYLTTFDSIPVGTHSGTFSMPAGSFTLTSHSHIVQGSAPTYAKPYQDNTRYASINTNGSITFNLSHNMHYMGLLWGSVDTYNALDFYRNGVLLGSVTGAQIIAAAGLIAGNQGAFGTVYTNITSEWMFNKVVARSSNIAFEFDDVRFSTVPLPAALPMFASLVLGGGLMGRRRRKALAAA